MPGLSGAVRVVVAVPPADLREGYDGLARLARGVIDRDPLSGRLGAFADRKRDRIEIPYRDRDGRAARMRRPGRGTFRRPAPNAGRVEWTGAEPAAVPGGIDLKETRRRPRFTPRAS